MGKIIGVDRYFDLISVTYEDGSSDLFPEFYRIRLNGDQIKIETIKESVTIDFDDLINKKGTTNASEFIKLLANYGSYQFKKPEDSVATFLKSELDGVSTNMNVDGSVTPKVFSLTANRPLLVNRLQIYLSGQTPFSSDKFGDLAELDNGCSFRFKGGEVGLFQNNRDIVRLAERSESHPFLSNEARHLIAFTDINPDIIFYNGEKIEMIINDNLSTLSHFYFRISGRSL